MDCTQCPDVRDPHLARMRAEFCQVVARWRLTQVEVRSLLGIASRETCVIEPGDLDADAVRRAALLIDLDRGLSRIFPDLGQLVRWLRTATRAFDGQTPLAAMLEIEALVVMVRVAGGGSRTTASERGDRT